MSDKQEQLENRFRKHLKDLDLTHLEAVITLARTYQILANFLFKVYGEKTLQAIAKALDMDEDKVNIMRQYFDASSYLLIPFQNMTLDEYEKGLKYLIDKANEQVTDAG